MAKYNLKITSNYTTKRRILKGSFWYHCLNWKRYTC